MSLTLSPEEIAEVTGKQRPTAQARQLETMGYPYRRRSDGSLLVLKADIRNETEEERPTPTRVRLPQTRRVLAGQEG